MIAMKFGGTSVGTPDNLLAACALVRDQAARGPLVVVSAANHPDCRTTDTLADAARQALGWRASRSGGPPGAGGLEREARLLAARQAARVAGPQRALARDLGVEAPETDLLLADFETLLVGIAMLGELSARTLDLAMSFGERMSAPLVAAVLREKFGMDARCRVSWELGLATDDQFGAARPLPGREDEIRRRVAETGGEVVVTTGFLGATPDGRVTTLGRGGSDYSAALFGAALGADEIQIWTDVPGVMTTDPRVEPRARTVPALSFREASELAWFGAKVLHPATMAPAIDRGIPIRVCCTADPRGPSTTVGAGVAGEAGRPKAVAFRDGVDLCSVWTGRMVGVSGFAAKVFEVFGRHGVDVQMIATSEASISVSAAGGPAFRAAAADLRPLGAVETREGMALVCVVGERMAGAPGVARRATGALAGAGVNIVMISQDAGEINMSFLVEGRDRDAAVRALHAEFFGPGAPA